MLPSPLLLNSVRVGSAQDARDEVDMTLGFDRNATKLLCAAETRLLAANATFVDCIDRSGPRERGIAAEAVQIAIGAHAFATSYQSTCRDELEKALTELMGMAESGSARSETTSVSAAQVVVAEASAIAAAAASKADETARAAGIVAQAVQSAATALAGLNVAAAAATERAVYDAAQSVEAVAHAAARGVAAASVRADAAATRHSMNR